MKTLSKLLVAVGLVAVGAPAFAQASANTSATGTTKIVQPIAISKTADLAFGTIVRTPSGTNTITIDATTGVRSIAGGGTGALATSTTGRATFTVSGEGAQTFSISVPATFNMTSGGNTIIVTPVASSATGTLSGTIGSAGTVVIGVGGSFPLPSTQASGSYSGSFTTTVTYN